MRTQALAAAVFALLPCACSDSDRAPEDLDPAGSGTGSRLDLDGPLRRPTAGDQDAALRHLQQALRLLQAGREEEALARFEQALAADPAHVPTRVQLGLFLLREGRHTDRSRSLTQFRSARLLEPDDALAICGEGIARQELGDDAGAAPLLERSLPAPRLDSAPGLRAMAQAATARLCTARGQQHLAEQHFRRAITLDPEPRSRATWRTQLGALHLEAGRLAEARDELKRAVADHPDHRRAHELLARTYGQLGNRQQQERERKIGEGLR